MKRDSNGRFVKGNSGNAGGRPKIPETQKELLRALVPEALEIKARLLRDNETAPELRNKIADSILDRVYGRAPVDAGDNGAIGAALDKAREILNGVDGETD